MLVQTEHLERTLLTANQNHQVYCGLDCCVTLEVFEELQRLRNASPAIYDFERALQAPYLDIMQRGFLVDTVARGRAIESLQKRIAHCREVLDEFAGAIWNAGLNPASYKQLQAFFFGAMQLPPIWISVKGVRRISCNRESLEKIDEYYYARPFVQLILRIRDLAKQLDFFTIGIDSDNRFRAGYNIAGTETGRPSSSENAFGTGGNAQNVAPHLRYVLVADPGMKMCVIDLEQVEARDVGYFCGCLFDDWGFLDACESGDLHTNNAKRIWPELPWPGDPAGDRNIAEQIFYREFSYRDMAKRGSHLSNYMGTAWTASRSLKVPLKIMENFQARYCRGGDGITPAFPVIPRYWQWVAQQLQTIGHLTTPFGRTRHFLGRPGDDATLREAIAFLPQSTTADRMNLGLWRVWKHLPQVQLLAQTYDSITFQFPEWENHDEIISKALDLIRVELVAPNGRRYVVPGDAKVGWNWANVPSSKQLAQGAHPNPLGLKKWKLGMVDDRMRNEDILERMVGA